MYCLSKTAELHEFEHSGYESLKKISVQGERNPFLYEKCVLRDKYYWYNTADIKEPNSVSNEPYRLSPSLQTRLFGQPR